MGRGRDAHLGLRLPSVSRRHLSLEPYREDGGTLLAFCLKVLSRRRCVWVNGLTLRYPEQVPLSPISRVAFSGVQMVVLEALVCCFQLSPSPLIHRPRRPMSRRASPQEPAGPVPGARAPGHLGLPQGPSQTWDSSLQSSPGGEAKILLQRESQGG